jgi:hypothetical protein
MESFRRLGMAGVLTASWRLPAISSGLSWRSRKLPLELFPTKSRAFDDDDPARHRTAPTLSGADVRGSALSAGLNSNMTFVQSLGAAEYIARDISSAGIGEDSNPA